MLTNNISRDRISALQYYQQGLSLDDYYRSDQVDAVYKGKLAERLGLAGAEVSDDNFSALLSGVVSGEKLRVRDLEQARVGYDFTANCQKSISLVYSITHDPAILEALQHANAQMMAEIEAYSQYQQNTETQRVYKYSGELVYSSYLHRATRPNLVKDSNGKSVLAPDPHLHVHNFVNAHTWNADKQRYQALELGDAVYRRLPYFEKVFHAHLAHGLQQAGYQIQRTENGFYELAGVSRSVLERFSNRTLAINDFADKHKITDPKVKGELGAKLRNAKSKASIKEKELFDHWLSRLSAEELSGIEHLKGKAFDRPEPLSLAACVDRAVSHHLEREAAAPYERVVSTALTYGYGSYLPDDVKNEISSREDILHHEIEGMEYITSEEMRVAEEKLIEMASSGKGKFPALNAEYIPKPEFLNQQQKHAISSILSTSDRTIILRGLAGTGKSTLLKSVADGVQQSGKSLYAACPSTQAVKVLEEDGFEATTVAALLHSQKLQERLRNQVLVLDEAGQCPLKDMSKVLALSEKLGFRCVLSGDTRQHAPVGQDALKILETQSKVPLVTVNKIQRQKPEVFKAAVQKMATGRTLEGLNDLEKRMDAIREIPDHEERINKLADDYIDSVSKGRSGIIISPMNFEGAQINEIVRGKLKEKGVVKGKDREVDQLHGLSYTDSQKRDLVNYSENMVLRFSKNQKGFRAGSHWQVLPVKNHKEVSLQDLKTGKVSQLPVSSAQHFEVYQKAKAPLAQGDLIRLTQNVRVEGKKLNNGNTYTVQKLSKKGITLDNGKTIPNDVYHWKHGHVFTSHSAQSKTKNDVFISMSDRSFAAVNEQSLYVAASRGQYNATIYTSSKDDLKRYVARSGVRVSAREVAEGHEQRVLQQKRQAHHRVLTEKQREHGRIQEQQKTASRSISKEFTRQ
ncbi:MAG: relaxase domain-containing protein [Cyclobacteriaceae bacterium]